MIEAVAEELADLRRDFDLSAEIGLHLKMADQTPIGTFDASLLRRLAVLDLDRDFDLYVVDDGYVPIDGVESGSLRTTNEGT